ncbi:hypothetical protein FQR65_LT16067 [Abscondita terminalis]|nr:hypothetical protein FQR65_LT16067 [Abscondita terminalis]
MMYNMDKDLVLYYIKSNLSREGSKKLSCNSFQYKFVLKPSYSIAGCREDSPAYKAGLRKNDKLVTVNGKPASSYTLEQLNELFKSEEFKVIKITVTRNSETFNFVFALEDPIPYNRKLKLWKKRTAHIETQQGKVDMAGAILATTAIMLMVYAIVSSESEGWDSKQKSEPLVPISIFKVPNLSAANIGYGIIGSSMDTIVVFP